MHSEPRKLHRHHSGASTESTPRQRLRRFAWLYVAPAFTSSLASRAPGRDGHPPPGRATSSSSPTPSSRASSTP
eukprot:11123088-Alexandrium_andersonii.AAC.1